MSQVEEDFRVELNIFRGPLDLLLYLVRKHELEVADIPIAEVLDQYLEFLDIMEQLSIDAVGDFLELASTLTEIKSRLVLPRVEEPEPEIEDPRDELVQRLLEYKQYRDAAMMLETRARGWGQRHRRQTNDLPPRKINMAQQPIQDVELWDLVSAMGRILKDIQVAPEETVIFDDTPIHVYMRQIHRRIVKEGRVALSQFFQMGMHKTAIIGMFLSILELVRHHGVDAVQDNVGGDIWVTAGQRFRPDIDVSNVEEYDHKKPVLGDMPTKMR